MYTALKTEVSAYCFGSRRFLFSKVLYTMYDYYFFYVVKFDIKCMIITFFL